MGRGGLPTWLLLVWVTLAYLFADRDVKVWQGCFGRRHLPFIWNGWLFPGRFDRFS